MAPRSQKRSAKAAAAAPVEGEGSSGGDGASLAAAREKKAKQGDTSGQPTLQMLLESIPKEPFQQEKAVEDAAGPENSAVEDAAGPENRAVGDAAGPEKSTARKTATEKNCSQSREASRVPTGRACVRS